MTEDPKILQALLDKKEKRIQEMLSRIEAAVTYIEHMLKDTERTWSENIVLQTILEYLTS